jgi:AcrR family transcriptional regulator
MGSAQKDTRDRLIGAAMRLFAEKGYQAASTSEIAREARANPGSLYFFFPTKQQLLIAVLERYEQGIGPMLLEPAWEGVNDPIERIFALLDRYRHLLVDSDCTYGCPIGNLALELHDPDPEVRSRLAANFDVWTAAIARCLDQARHRLPEDADVTALSSFVLTIMEGAVMQARTYRSVDPFDRAVRMLRDYFTCLTRSTLGGAP